MKKILFTFLFSIWAAFVFAQTSPVFVLKVANATTAFGQDLPFGTRVENLATGENWKTISDVADGTLTTRAAYFIPETDVKATLPLVSDGAPNPTLSINDATPLTSGAMSAADKARLDSISGENTGDQDLSGSGATLSGYVISLSGDATTVTLPNEIDPAFATDSALVKTAARTWNASIAKGITGTDTARWNDKYTKAQIATFLGAKADTTDINSIIDSLENIYTEAQVNTLLGAKTDTIDTNSLFNSLSVHLDTLIDHNLRLLEVEGFTLSDFGGSNTALSNLASVAINTSLISDANNTDDLGTSALAWRTGYFGTSVFSPLIVGGSAAGSKITYKSTTGAGTATGIAHQFTGGTNGGTVLGTVLNNGNWGYGTIEPIRKVHIQSDTDASLYLRRNSVTVGDYSEILFNVSTANTFGSAIRNIRTSTGGNDFVLMINSSNTYEGLLEAFRIQNTTGNIGVNSLNPNHKFEVINNTAGVSNIFKIASEGTGSHTIFNLYNSNPTPASNRNIFQAVQSRGTLAAPTSLLSGDFIFSIVAMGHDGTGYQTRFSQDIFVDNTVSTGVVPLSVKWMTSNNSSARTEKMRLTSDGNFIVGTTDVDGTPAIGRVIIKGTTNNGTTNILVGRDSDESNVYLVNTDGQVTHAAPTADAHSVRRLDLTSALWAHDATSYKLNGNNLFSTLDEDTIPLWDGDKFINSPISVSTNDVIFAGKATLTISASANDDVPKYSQVKAIARDSAAAAIAAAILSLEEIYGTMAEADSALFYTKIQSWVNAQEFIDTTYADLTYVKYTGANAHIDVNSKNITTTGKVTTGTFQMTSGATDGYYLKSDATGNGTWTSVAASQVYKGTWNANTNTPTLADGSGTAGWYYRVVVGDTIDLGGGSIIFLDGDDVSYNGSIWQRIPGQGFILQEATTDVLGGIKGGSGTLLTDGVLSIPNDHVAVTLGTANGLSLSTQALSLALASAEATGALSNTAFANFTTAYTDRLKWDGGSTGLTASTGRTSLGGTTVGQAFFTLANPSAITFPQINAENTVSALTAAEFRTAIGAGTSTVTPAALTKVDDTNVTLTIGGTPLTSLLQSVSLTVGWTGTLADERIASAATWNAKQDALVSATNIKTVNGTTLLGSGDLGLITGQYGGTGVDNTGKTITLGGNLTTSGAYAATFTLTGTTNVTFPTSGTLATTAQITGTNSGTNTGDIVPVCEPYTLPSGTGALNYEWVLSNAPKTTTGITVTVNGSTLTPTTQYTVSGSTVTFLIPTYKYDQLTAYYAY